MIPTMYAAAWIFVYGNMAVAPTVIPMPSMKFCQEEAYQITKDSGWTNAHCIAGQDTRSKK